MTVVSFIAYSAAKNASTPGDEQGTPENQDRLDSTFFYEYLLALVSALCINVYIVGINQIFDVEIDRVNKPYLPLASGEWTTQFACRLCLGLLACGLGLGFYFGTVALQCTLGVSAALGTAYSTDVPLLRWKKYPLLAASCILSVRSVVVQIGFFCHIQERLPNPVEWWDCSAIQFSIMFFLAFSVWRRKEIPLAASMSAHFSPSAALRACFTMPG